MSECIICGTEVEGADICSLHEEDVLFTFTGDSPEQLVEGRYYDGTVDGFADFGVFIDLGNGVTGLLHRNELDQRLESLGWDEGDQVCVQVTNVRSDGNVDLGPSIRQSAADFRGALTQGPDDGPAPDPISESDGPVISTDDAPVEDLDRSQIRSLDRYLGRNVALEGVIEDIRQTGGPTVFTLVDESGSVECAAFAGAGVRAHPEVEVGDTVRIRGKVEHRFDDHQIEVEGLDRLTDAASETVRSRVVESAVIPDSIDELPLMYADAANLAVETDIREAAAAIRSAISRDQTIRIRHPVSVDGFVSASAIERSIEAVLNERAEPVPVHSRVRRRPVEEVAYDIPAALEDVESDSDDEQPFILLVDLGSTNEARGAFDLLELFDVDFHVIDTANPDPQLLERVSPLVNPWCGEGTYPIPSTASVAINVAGLLAEDVRDELRHVPAVADPADLPESAELLLDESDYDHDDIEAMHQAITLEAFYQPWGDKRALIRRILFEHAAGTIEPISEQFQTKLEQAIETAKYNASVEPVNGSGLVVLDAEKYGQRFDFPPLRVLLDGLLDAGSFDAEIAVGVNSDTIELTGYSGNLALIAHELETRIQDGGITHTGGNDGQIRFLPGCRESVLETLPDAIAATVE